MPKVSIIIPVYNTEQFIRQCVESCIGQTLKDIEIICINDGSTDKSPEILKELAEKDERIILISQENHGVSFARNTGLKLAKAEYIMFVDSDDYIKPNMVEDYYNKMIEENVDLVCGTFTNIPVDDSEITQYRINKFKLSEHCITGKYYFTQKIFKILGLYSYYPYAKLLKKSIIDKYNISFPENLIHEDIYFIWVYFTRIKKIYYLSGEYYFRTVNKNSYTSNLYEFGERSDNRVKIMKLLLDYLLSNNLFCTYKNLYICTYANTMTYYKGKSLSSETKKIKNEIEKIIYPPARFLEKIKKGFIAYCGFPLLIYKIYKKVCL